jgi:hypothetical protein
VSHGYVAENHDWDLTLRAAWSLAMIGQTASNLPTGGEPRECEFACYTGSMLLSFSAIESFSASVAFSMPREERFRSFDFENYTRASRFWDKMTLLCDAIPYRIDKSQGLFQTVGEMQRWRNLVTHASPYRIEPTIIPNTTHAPTGLHSRFHGQEYTRKVNLENAKKFYECAVEYVKLIQELTGITPRAMVQYTVGSDDSQS